MIKVPREIQVRIIKAQSEDAVPRFIIKEEIKNEENKIKKIVKKLLSGSIIGAFLGLGVYLALELCGIKFGGLETSILLAIPVLTGLITSYIIF